jgi:DNA-binding MarR family transcriptional regulator
VIARAPHELDHSLREVLQLGLDVRHALARRLGISMTELSAIEHLTEHPMGPVDLSRRLDLTSAATTLLLHRLEESGHVARSPHPTDGRRQLVAPTARAAQEVFAELRPMLQALDDAALALSPAERSVVVRYLGQVAEVLRTTIESGPDGAGPAT